MAMGLSVNVFKNCFGESYIAETQLCIYLAFTEQLMLSWAVQRHLSGQPQSGIRKIWNWATFRRHNWMRFNVFKHNFANKLLGLHLDDPNETIFPAEWRSISPGLQCNGCKMFGLTSPLDMRRSLQFSRCLAPTLTECSLPGLPELTRLQLPGEDLLLVREVDRVLLHTLNILRKVWGSPQFQPNLFIYLLLSRVSCLS